MTKYFELSEWRLWAVALVCMTVGGYDSSFWVEFAVRFAALLFVYWVILRPTEITPKPAPVRLDKGDNS